MCRVLTDDQWPKFASGNHSDPEFLLITARSIGAGRHSPMNATREQQKISWRRPGGTTVPPSHSIVSGSVLVRDAHTGLWDRTGVINGAGNFKSYLVKMPSRRPHFPKWQRKQ